MEVKGIKIAVISDLHCHHSDQGKQESWFLSDLQSNPVSEHPVESLLELIKSQNIEADFLLVPGDLANKVDEQGFCSAWEALQRIGQELKVKKIIATIGNHDVDSRAIEELKKGSHPEDPFHIARTLATSFPVSEESLWNEFWAKGFCIVDDDISRILSINSCFFHLSKTEAEKGYISDWQIEKLKQKLANLSPKTFSIAMCHHHPHPHEHSGLGYNDLMKNGNVLLKLLSDFNFNIIIHGHKHDPFLSYAQGGNDSIAVFSAGSFSVYQDKMLQNTKNTFHILEVTDSKIPNCHNHGKIITYAFTFKKGWGLTDKISDYFPTYAGFGCRMIIQEIAEKTNEWFLNHNKSIVEWKDLIDAFPHLEYLPPSDLIKYGKILFDSYNIKFYPEPPSIINLVGKPN